MKQHSIFSILAFSAAIAGAGALASCNEEKKSDIYQNPVNLAVTAFSLKADAKNPGLDSAYFAIDLERGIIFNADSLRKGTKINKVVPNITFSGTVSEAVIVMSGGTTREGEVDFRTNPTDSIDFTGDVTLRVKADDNKIGTTYRLKVNVHKMPTDSIIWEENQNNFLGIPEGTDVAGVKVINTESRITSFSLLGNGTSAIVSSTTDLTEGDFVTVRVDNLPFTPDVDTMCADGETIYVLDTSGRLWFTKDLTSARWTDSGEQWHTLIGAYNDTAVGLRGDGSGAALQFSQYPLTDLNVKAIPDDFPTSGCSNFVKLENKWTQSPVAFFVGGVRADRSLSSDTWAFDGSEWIKLNEGGIPATSGATVIPYYNYRSSASGNAMIEYEVWFMVGGKTADGYNNKVYISYDNGVNWTGGPNNMQLPESMSDIFNCSGVVSDTEKSASLADSWTLRGISPRRLRVWTEGETVHWNCPYIYLFGYKGANKDIVTCRGVLTRLTFTPII